MANRFLVAGGTGNWDSTTNWSATSGGASGASFPVAGDVVAFDSNSGNAAMTVNVASACASLVMSGTYAGTLTFNSTLTLTSTCTFVAACTIAGTTGTLICTGTATLTSGTKTLTCALTLSGSGITYTLADNWTVSGLVSIGSVSGSSVNSNKITCAGGLTVLSSGTSSGTAKLEITGGTWSYASTATLRNNVDLAGTVTISGTLTYNTGTLKYVSGTITTTGSTINTGSVNTTFDTSGVTWNSLGLGSATHTLSSALAWSGTLAITAPATLTGAGAVSGTGAITVSSGTVTINNTGGITTTGTMTLANASITFAGTSGWTVGTLTNTTYTVSRTVTLTFGNTYTVTTSILNVGTTAAIRQAFVSSSAGNKVVFNVTAGATEALLYADPTDIDSSGGAQVTSINGTITTSLNWTSNVSTSPAATTTLINCMITQHTDSYA
jgi:fibronectin-binding autotransporter adhesin